MDPYDEQTLRNEVLFLHSLWHQGPPPPPPPPPQHHHFFHPLNPPLFKNPKRPSKHQNKFKKMKTQQHFHASTSEWPCPSPPPSNSTTWPSFPTTQLPSHADIHFSSIKVQAWDVGNRMQLKVVQEVKNFFKNQKNESDDDDDEDDDDEMESGDEDEEGGGNGDCLGFFLKLFEEIGELREFYVKNKGNGDFGCLVCGGVGFIRRFKDCVALVQHTVSISKTKKVKAHRAFGKAVCEVIGWDINKLPSIASSISEKKNEGSSKLEEDQTGVQEKLTNEDHNVESHDKETGEKEIDGAEQLVDSGALAVSEEKLTNEDHNVDNDKETGAQEIDGAEQLPDSGALIVTEIVGGDDSIATKPQENAADIEQGNIEGSLDCLEAGHSNGLSSVDGNSSIETKGKEAIGDEKLPTTDTSNQAQSLQSVFGVGTSVHDKLEETLDSKQENAESTSN